MTFIQALCVVLVIQLCINVDEIQKITKSIKGPVWVQPLIRAGITLITAAVIYLCSILII